MVRTVGEYQEAGRLLDAVLGGHRIEIMPNDPIEAIAIVFKAYRSSRRERPDDVVRSVAELYVDQVIKALETWLDYPVVTVEGE